MIQFHDVAKRFANGHYGLNNVSFQLEESEMAFLTGHSGAGKSTLLKLIALIDQCTLGEIIVNSLNVNRISARQLPYARRNIGIIFQDHNLLDEKTVFDNVALPLIIEGYKHDDINSRVRASLEKVGLKRKYENYPSTLSAGEQQRVGIARALVNRPPVLLADEPTGNLDPDLSLEIMKLFAEFNQTVGSTVMIATHDLGLVNKMGYRTIELNQGTIAHDRPQNGTDL